ncbi:hypothetical protein BDV25DRAFT_152887 [Aspergillus avenaceus]|uniref:Pentatricopeptide repeat protein n=1 Tax=Aspergillus avenaceus TaxID=36643 RepID=A0A5N6TZ11_ASPAV|nr:hypothetical protein BDV25DRAFT_152887 [Aspergillus avenaceus]
MLRYSNAAALPTGLKNSMAMRLSSVPRWSRAIQGGGNGIAHVSPKAFTPGQTGSWRAPAGTKDFSTDADRFEAAPAVGKGRRGANANTNSYLNKSKANKVMQRDPLLALAKSATSAGFRKEVEAARSSKVSTKVVEMELVWLKDPRALGDRVSRMLITGQYELAVALIRAAQKERMDCGSAWNHLFAHCMKQNSPEAAFRFYNEMKKRGRRPNAWTYTIMLDGLSKVDKTYSFKPVEVALSIYKSINAPESGVTRNMHHTNAMLNVCSRHNDMDTLWQIAGELPENGPDQGTYSIILRAIRHSAVCDIGMMSPHMETEILARKAQAVKEAKRLWSDIVFRWNSATLDIDGLLVTAMTRALLEGGTDRDCYDVFALHHQTCGLPILATKPNHDPSRKGLKKRKRQETVDHVPFEHGSEELYRPPSAERSGNEENEEESFENVFDPIVSPKVEPEAQSEVVTEASYIPLTNRELANVLEACQLMTQGIAIGRAYWNHLTRTKESYRVEPDSANCHQYLRLLRHAHSSRDSLALIRDQMVPGNMATGKTFHIALTTCRRDRNNLNVLAYASELVTIMGKTLVVPFPRALHDYIDLIRSLGGDPATMMSLRGLNSDNQSSANLDTVGKDLRAQLYAIGVENLRPHLESIVETMDHGLMSPVRLINGRMTHKPIPHAILGDEALNLMLRAKGLIDEVLSLDESRKALTKPERELLEEEAKKLGRKYSTPEAREKYQLSLLAPTPKQIAAVYERMKK